MIGAGRKHVRDGTGRIGTAAAGPKKSLAVGGNREGTMRPQILEIGIGAGGLRIERLGYCCAGRARGQCRDCNDHQFHVLSPPPGKGDGLICRDGTGCDMTAHHLGGNLHLVC